MANISILLVESDSARAEFVQEALAEAGESAGRGDWVGFSVAIARQLIDALDMLDAGRFDVVLLNPNLMDSPASATIAALRPYLAEIPVVLLVDAAEETAARRTLRDGVQDYLLWSELDCDPLSRALRSAMERHKRASALRAASVTDEITRLLNRSGFEMIARRELTLADEAGQRVTLLVADIDNFEEVLAACGGEQAAWILSDAADVLRDSIGTRALLARIGRHRFAALAWRAGAELLIGRIQKQLGEISAAFAFSFGWFEREPNGRIGFEALLMAASAVLCENTQDSIRA
jgi:PleD family two-component response regulator